MRNYYTVRLDGVKFYDPSDDELILINPVVKNGIDEAGSFDFTIDTNHKYYNSITTYGSSIEVFEDGVSIFYGRPTPPSINLYGQKTFHCEGALAFLNDIVLAPMSKYVDAGDFTSDEEGGEGEEFTSEEEPDEEGKVQRTISTSEYLSYVFEKYNQFQGKSTRKLTLRVSQITTATLLYNSDFKTCLDILREEILPYCGVYLMTSRQNGTTFVETRSTFGGGNQPITAGVNLLDFVGTMQEFYTAIIAKGAAKDGDYAHEEAVRLEEPMTLGSSIISQYGTICAFKEFPECESEEALEARCSQFLREQQFNKMNFDVSAIDLHLDNDSYAALKVGQKVTFRSPAHGLTATLVVSAVEVRLDTGEKKLTIGERFQGISTMTQNWVTQVKKKKKADDIYVEDLPIQGDPNPISSGGVYDALQGLGTDKWIHQIDGVTQETGTVNFVTG